MLCEKCSKNDAHFTGAASSYGPSVVDVENTPDNLPGGFAWLCDDCLNEIAAQIGWDERESVGTSKIPQQPAVLRITEIIDGSWNAERDTLVGRLVIPATFHSEFEPPCTFEAAIQHEDGSWWGGVYFLDGCNYIGWNNQDSRIYIHFLAERVA